MSDAPTTGLIATDAAPAAAASPRHPRHAAWVKDQTLQIEAHHVQRVGGTFRGAEFANAVSLDRLERAKRGPKRPRRTPKTVSVADRQVARAAQGLTYKPVAPIAVIPALPCNACGRCKHCRRSARIAAIHGKAREGEVVAVALSWELAGAMLAWKAGKNFRGGTGTHYDFSTLSPATSARAFVAAVDDVCDRSVRLLGAWRR